MNEAEITRLCAEAMGYEEYKPQPWWTSDDRAKLNVVLNGLPHEYDPLHDWKQLGALVKKFKVEIEAGTVTVESSHGDGRRSRSFSARFAYDYSDIESAICKCVAEMQKSREKQRKLGTQET